MAAEESDETLADRRAVVAGRSGASPASSDLVFKVVTYQGVRQGFRLEQIFWRVLRFAAARSDMPVNAYIHSILNHGERNKAAALRFHAAEWLTRQLVEARAHAIHPTMLTKLVAVLPQPSIVVDLSHRIVAQNDAFLSVLRDQSAGPLSEDKMSARIRLMTPISALQGQLDEMTDHFIVDALRIDCGGRPIERPVRVCSIDAANGNSLGLLVMITD